MCNVNEMRIGSMQVLISNMGGFWYWDVTCPKWRIPAEVILEHYIGQVKKKHKRIFFL